MAPQRKYRALTMGAPIHEGSFRASWKQELFKRGRVPRDVNEARTLEAEARTLEAEARTLEAEVKTLEAKAEAIKFWT